MKDNFINDFKIYCETVDSIEGLEIIRDNILSFIINLETFTDDYLNKDGFTVDETEDGYKHYYGNGAPVVTVTYTDGTTTEINVTPNDGVICVELNAGNVASVTISPVLGK